MTALIDTDLEVPTRDGTSLATTMVRPYGPGAHPVILMRTPYDRATYASVSLQVHALALAEAGYAVVLQDVRGRGRSTGEFTPFLNEQADGLDTVDWLLDRQWCNGSIGLAGISYNAFTQTALATANHEAVKCWVPGLAASDVRTSWIRRGGLLDLGFHLSWGLGSIAPLDRRTPDPDVVLAAYDHPVASAGRGPNDQPEMRSTPAGDWLFAWAGSEDPYPDTPSVPGREQISAIEAPALVVAGWFDVFSNGSVELAAWLRKGPSGGRHRMVAGPWDHSGLPLGRRAGARDFGRRAIMDLHQLQLGWFDQHLRDGDEVTSDLVFVTGPDVWQAMTTWPPPVEQVSVPLASEDGLTLEGASAVAGEVAVDVIGETPLSGGALFPWEPVLRSGAFDQRSRRMRPDVLSFSGPPLEAPVQLAGSATVELTVGSTAPLTPVHVTLVEVGREGPVWNVADGMGLVDGSTGRVTVELGPVAHRFAPGSAIGLDLAFSARARIAPAVPGRRVVDLSPGTATLTLPIAG